MTKLNSFPTEIINKKTRDKNRLNIWRNTSAVISEFKYLPSRKPNKV